MPVLKRPSGTPVVVSLLVGCVALAAGGYAYYEQQALEIRKQRVGQLDSIATLKADQIAGWRRELVGDVRLAAADPFLRAGLADWVARPEDTALQSRLRDRLRLPIDANRAHDATLASADGRLLLSARPDRRDLDADERSLALRVAGGGQAMAGELVRSSSGHVVFRVAGPILDGDRRVEAVLIESVDPAPTLFGTVQSWPTLSASAETLIARRDGDHVVYLNPLRHRPDPPLAVTVPVTERHVPAVRLALSGAREVFEGLDYRGVETVADLRPIPDSSWLLVNKIDKAEIFADLRFRGWMTLLLVLLCMACSAGLAGVVYVNRHREVYRHLSIAERERADTFEETRAIVYSIGDGIITTDAAARVTRLNPVAERLTGWPEADAQGQPIANVFHIVNEETRREVENPVWRVLHEGGVVGLANHTVLVARDGVERPIADSGAPVLTPDGGVSGAVLVFRDQTEERRATDELKAASRQWQTTFDAMVDAVVLLDADGIIVKGNRAFMTLVGDALPEPVGRNIEDLRTCGILRLPECQIRRAKETRARARQEAEVGDRVYLVVTDPILTGPDDPVAGFVCALRDITQRKRDLEERERLQAELHQTWKMESVGRLAGGVAHDFNNMLGVILGHLELAMGELDSAHPASSSLQEVKLAAQHSVSLTSQLLAFARQQPIFPQVLDLNQTIGTLLPMVRRLIGENIQLVWVPGAELWAVEADATQVGSIVANLALNARDAIGGVGTVTLGTENVEVKAGAARTSRAGVEPGAYVVLSVTDTGSGMDEKTLGHLFEPFFTTKPLGQGTGLGLATVYGVVKQNGGFVDVESAPGRGATFTIYLPRAASGAEPAAAPNDGARSGGGSETILLVEDEPAMLALARRFLERAGYRVLAADRPSVALELAARHDGPIHLLLTDVVTPEMNGRDLRDRLLAMRPDLKVLFMSGYTADVITHQGRLEADVQFLQKPFTAGSFTEAVRIALNR